MTFNQEDHDRLYTREYYEYEGQHSGKQEAPAWKHQVLRKDQEIAIELVMCEPPGLIVSVGAGMGLLERELENRGQMVIATEPSTYALENGRSENRIRCDLGSLRITTPCTWLFSESMEHIPEPDIWAFMEWAKGRLVVANWTWPLETNCPDHITRMDDAFFDKMCDSRHVYHRNAGYLLLRL